MHVKKGDTVKILAGKDRGKTGKVVKSLPKLDKVVVEGINLVKKNRKPRTSNEKGQIIDVAMPIHVSNLKKTKTDSPKKTKTSKKPKA